jgi:hypothetical protein
VTRFIAEYKNNVSTAIDAPTMEAAEYAALQYSEVNRLCGHVVRVTQPPAYLRVNAEGVVETFWVDGTYRPICPEGAPVPERYVATNRVLALVKPSEVEVMLVPPDWDQERIAKYLDSRHDWSSWHVTTLEEVNQK